MRFTDNCCQIFQNAIEDYHISDDVNQVLQNPYLQGTTDSLLYQKCWIDTVQWHLEDIIRNPDIDPTAGMNIKRRIDVSNQERTDLVEQLDLIFFEQFQNIEPIPDSSLNTETPAWSIDRLSILQLKLYHWKLETERKEISEEQFRKSAEKYAQLLEQEKDLKDAIELLIHDLGTGVKKMKLYRQMKMYNDPNLNPVLYNKNK